MKHDHFDDYLYVFGLEGTQPAPAHGTRVEVYRKYGKRALDFGFSIFLLLPALPIFLIAAVSAPFSRGPVFHMQERIGRDGKVFMCYKFRTMVPDAEERLEAMCREDETLALEWKTYQKLRNDPRITRLGRFLRKTSLDELPQLLNVLKGDMSVVGPRPFLVNQESIYREAGGRAYFNLLPGITGAWQVSERHGTEFATRVAYDEAYNRNLSFLA